MTQLIINVGASANDGLGDPLRTSFTYCNSNFSELYSRVQTTPPDTFIGVPGDQAGMYAYDSTYFYYCFADFDGVSDIWNKALTISEPGNYGNANVAAYLNGSAGTIVPANNGVQTLGNVTRSFKDVFLSNSTITLNSIPITVIGTNLLVNGSNVVVASSIDGSISVTGNITGNYFVGNGSLLTGIDGNYSNANVAAYLPTYSGNLNAGNITTPGFINAVGNTRGGNLRTIGQVTATGNVYGGNILAANAISAGGTIYGAQFSGDGNTISNIQGTSVSGNVTSAVTAGTVTTNAQANITSVGTLTTKIASGLVSTTGNIVGANILTAGLISATGPVSVGVYTATNLNLVTGSVGALAAVSNSPTVGGRLAFWDTTNARWSYVSDNTAV